MQTNLILSFKIDEQIKSKESINKIYAGMHWKQRQELVDHWHEIIYYAMLQQKVERNLIDVPVDIIVYSNDDLDADNHFFVIKMIIDTMCEYPVLKDDTRKYIKSVKFEFYDGEGIKVDVYKNSK